MALYDGDRMDLTTLFPDVGDPRWIDLPIAVRKFVYRAATLQRLVALNAPDVIIRNQRVLAAEAYVDLGQWFAVSTLTPAQEYSEALFEAEMAQDIPALDDDDEPS